MAQSAVQAGKAAEIAAESSADSNKNKVIEDSRLHLQCALYNRRLECHLEKSMKRNVIWLAAKHDVIQQRRKYVTYCTVARKRPNNDHRCNM